MPQRKLPLPTTWRLREPRSGQSRIPFVQRCRLDGKDGARHGLLCDLSVLGAYVAIEPVPALGEAFTLCFSLLHEDLPIIVDGTVTWRNTARGVKVGELPPGCGLKFVGLESKDLQRIQQLVTAVALGSSPRPHNN